MGYQLLYIKQDCKHFLYQFMQVRQFKSVISRTK